MTQHTPGPWFSIATSNIGHNAVVDADGFTVCSPSPMGAGNARLIAAAPDLLAALEAFVGARKGDGNGWTLDSLEALAREAIAKAKGNAACEC